MFRRELAFDFPPDCADEVDPAPWNDRKPSRHWLIGQSPDWRPKRALARIQRRAGRVGVGLGLGHSVRAAQGHVQRCWNMLRGNFQPSIRSRHSLRPWRSSLLTAPMHRNGYVPGPRARETPRNENETARPRLCRSVFFPHFSVVGAPA
jgi:hypothetical protein